MGKKEKATLIENLKKHINLKPLSFHTPGHKNGEIIPAALQNLWPQEIWKSDLTEIGNLDNLHAPQGCLKEAQRRAAQLVGAKKTYFLVNGSSVGLHAALLALSYQKQIFVPRHVHKAVYNGIILAGAQPISLPVTLDKDLGIPLGIEPEVLEKYIHLYPECKLLILPNPTYQGISYKIKETVQLAKERGLTVILDEAHGSHFFLHPDFPEDGLSLGADLVIQSWHKTLPALTQAAVLHVNRNYKGPDPGDFLRMLQTTSPSYLLLASLDGCRSWLEDVGDTLPAKTITQICAFKQEMQDLKNIRIISFSQGEVDPLKMCLSSNKVSGYGLADFLSENYHIYVELAEVEYCLLIFGLDIPNNQLQLLGKALREIDKSLEPLPEREKTRFGQESLLPLSLLSPQKAVYAPKEVVSVEKALGRICGEYIVKYPPGVPLVIPGEVISEAVINILREDKRGLGKTNVLVVKPGEEKNHGW